MIAKARVRTGSDSDRLKEMQSNFLIPLLSLRVLTQRYDATGNADCFLNGQ
jgi:hypothetical protein